jgi:hypothetical protein
MVAFRAMVLHDDYCGSGWAEFIGHADPRTCLMAENRPKVLLGNSSGQIPINDVVSRLVREF